MKQKQERQIKRDPFKMTVTDRAGKKLTKGKEWDGWRIGTDWQISNVESITQCCVVSWSCIHAPVNIVSALMPGKVAPQSFLWSWASSSWELFLYTYLSACIISPLGCLWHHREWDNEYKHSLSTNGMPGSALGMAMLNTSSTRSLEEEADLHAIRQVQ